MYGFQYVDSCNYYHNQDTEHFHHPPNSFVLPTLIPGGLVARSCLTLAAPNSHSKKSVKWVNEFQLCSCKFRFSAFSHLDSIPHREIGF